MNDSSNWVGRMIARMWRALSMGSVASVLLTAFNVATHGPRHLLLHLGLHALRVRLLRTFVYLLVGPISLMLAIVFALIWLTYRPTTPADVVPVDGTVAAYGRDDLDRFVIVLQEYENSFVLHAEVETFDTNRFVRTVQPGDQLHFSMRKTEHAKLNNGDLLVVYEIRSNDHVFVDVGSAVAAEHHDRTVVLPWTAASFAAIGAACAALFVWDKRRMHG